MTELSGNDTNPFLYFCQLLHFQRVCLNTWFWMLACCDVTKGPSYVSPWLVATPPARSCMLFLSHQSFQTGWRSSKVLAGSWNPVGGCKQRANFAVFLQSFLEYLMLWCCSIGVNRCWCVCVITACKIVCFSSNRRCLKRVCFSDSQTGLCLCHRQLCYWGSF